MIIDIKVVSVCSLFFIVGIVLVVKNYKFYKRDASTMLLPAEFRLFLGGLIVSLLGLWGLIDAVLKAMK